MPRRKQKHGRVGCPVRVAGVECKRVSMLLPLAKWERIRAAAKASDLNASQLIRRAIEAAMGGGHV